MLWTALVPAFLASLVEFVEALTIVLAIGVAINWKSSIAGALAAALVLGGLILVLRATLIQEVPLELLRRIIGLLLILFGAQWLRKALLRSSGLKSFRDEGALYQRQLTKSLAARTNPENPRPWSAYGMATSFKSVLLEGLEVAFIVVTFGATTPRSPSQGLTFAAIGAGAALVVVIVAGILVHKPLVRVPENLLKWGVGWLLVTFGIFWAGEGLGFSWPAGDAFLLVLAAGTGALCLGILFGLRASFRRGRCARPDPVAPSFWLFRIGFELYDFFAGDWRMVFGLGFIVVAMILWPSLLALFAPLVWGLLGLTILSVPRRNDREKKAKPEGLAQ